MHAVASALSRAGLATFACAALTIAAGFPAQAQDRAFEPVTDVILEHPDPADGIEAVTRAFAKIIDDVNELELEELRRR